MNGYYIVTPDGQRWPLMALSVDHQFDRMEFSCLDDTNGPLKGVTFALTVGRPHEHCR